MTIEFEPRILADYLRLECTGTYSQEAVLGLYEQAFALAANRSSTGNASARS